MIRMLWLRVVPLSVVAFEQYIGFPRAPATGRILRHGGGLGRAPNIEDGVDERPGGLDAADAHLRSRPLRSERNRDAFIGLDVQYQPVGFHVAFPENDVRRAPELDHDFRGAL